MNWEKQGTLIIGRYADVQLRSVAAFDLDGTLIKTKSGKRFPKDANDWVLWHDNIPAMLKSMGHDICIISNQLGISKGKVDAQEIEHKIEAVANLIDLPMIVILATADDHMRKPRIGTIEYLGVKPVFYCGDAAGRRQDFASSDYRFALNLDIDFYTPDMLFMNHNDSNNWNVGFDPRTIPIGVPMLPIENIQEILVLCGPPASGKSWIANNQCNGYAIVNQDTLKTKAKCIKVCRQFVTDGFSVVIDATNRDANTRRSWIDIGHEAGVQVRCVMLDVIKDLSMHVNTYRRLYGQSSVPAIAIHIFFSKYEPPSDTEGFDGIVKLAFVTNNDDIRRFL